MAKNPALETKVIIKDVMISYAYLAKPRKGLDGAEEKYSCMILVPKTDTAQVNKIKAAIKNAYQNGMDDLWNGKAPVKPNNPLRDGDLERAEDPNCKGMWFINANSKTKPGVIDKKRRDLTDGENALEIHSGMICHVSVNFFPFATSGNKGVACGLNNVLKVDEGKYLGGRAAAEADFDEFLDPDDFTEERSSQPKAEASADDWMS